jgi:hypothetical protein
MKKNFGFFGAKCPNIKEFLAVHEKTKFSHIQKKETYLTEMKKKMLVSLVPNVLTLKNF